MISPRVPPRWTVAARAQSAFVHGIGPSSAQSSLNTPGPYRKPGERLAVPTRHGVAGDRQHLARCEVEQDRIGRRQLGQRLDAPVALDPAAQLLEHGNEGVGDLLRATARQRPPDEMGEHAEHQAVARRRRRLQAEDRVAGEPAEHRLRLVGVEPAATDRVRREHTDGAVTGQGDRVLWRDRQRREQPVGEIEPRLDERPEQPAVRLRISAQTVGGLVDRAVEHGGTPAVERVRQRHGRLDPLEAVIAQW